MWQAIIVGLLLVFAFPAAGQTLPAETASCQADWLFSHQIQLYSYLLGSPGLPKDMRDNISGGAHRLAFEYFLLCRLGRAEPSLWWRSHLRDVLHRNGSNGKAFEDPAGLLPYFKEGQLEHGIGVSLLAGIDPHIWTQKQYRALVERFQLSYLNPISLFPALPVPTPDGSPSGSGMSFVGKRWPLVSFDGLSIEDQKRPFAAYERLSPKLRAYYLPAFLRMCERFRGEVGQLPQSLMESLSGDAPAESDTKAALSVEQRRCVLAFFDDLFRLDPSARGQLAALCGSLGVSLDESLKLRD